MKINNNAQTIAPIAVPTEGSIIFPISAPVTAHPKIPKNQAAVLFTRKPLFDFGARRFTAHRCLSWMAMTKYPSQYTPKRRIHLTCITVMQF
jgi:hypothetical protein